MMIMFNIFLFIFGIFIGVGLVISEAIDKGFMIKNKKTNKYNWIKKEKE